MIELIETTANEFWLVEETGQTNGNIIGNAVRLSKYFGDDYYFIHDVPLMKVSSVKNRSKPEKNELLFFDYVKRMKEISGRKFIVEDFNVSHYLKSH
ncbi:MAG TPA: hypothetical protein K8V28_11815 [Enterococcus gallinarum]|nr:hypothetical protein [Enterococcus gallinarum]